MRRFIVWSLGLLLLFAPLALIAALVLCIEERPTITRSTELTVEQIDRAKRIFKAHNPRLAPPNALRTFTIAVEDLDLAANYLLAQNGGGAKIALKPGAIMLWASAKLPASPLGSYVNVEALARQTSGMPEIESLRIGRLPVPSFIANWLLARALAHLNETAAGMTAADTLRSLRISDGHLVVEYQWRPELADRLRSALLPQGEQERLRAYHEHLVEMTASPKFARQISLVDLLRPLIALAAKRSANADAALENRSAILALTFYVNGRGLAAIVPAAKDWPRPTPRKVTLSGRGDFTQHFTISAAIAATAGSPLADAVGLYKEVEDAKGGSGFSFTDIAADRAGTLFGQHATRSVNAARALQSRIGVGVVEADFMPRADDLPEMMRDPEFKRRFGGVGAPAYTRMMDQIEQRIARLALYR